MSTLKVREARARRALVRVGYHMQKMPARSSMRRHVDPGYLVIYTDTNFAVLGADPYCYSASIEDVEQFAERKAREQNEGTNNKIY